MGLELEMFPSKAEIKEFNIVIRLSTKGMMHSFSKKQISNQEISPEFSQVKSVLSQLEKAHVVEIIGMTKSSSGSELKKIQTVIVLGKKSTGVSPSPESHQAASLDKIRLTIHTPKIWAKSTFLNLLEGVSKALLLGNIESEQIISGTEGVVIAEARADRISQVVTLAKVITPTREFVMKNLRLMGLTRFVLPATGIRAPMEVAALKLTGDRIPSTCRVEPSYVRTFDNMTVEYPINDCEHVLLLDGSKHIPVAVTTRTVQSKKIVKILSGITEVQMVPSSGSMKVMVNGEQLTLPAIGEQLIKKSTEGKILLIVQRFEDNVVFVHIPEQGLKVLTNGSMIEVVAPQLFKSRP